MLRQTTERMYVWIESEVNNYIYRVYNVYNVDNKP